MNLTAFHKHYCKTSWRVACHQLSVAINARIYAQSPDASAPLCAAAAAAATSVFVCLRLQHYAQCELLPRDSSSTPDQSVATQFAAAAHKA
jgi:hypothetical protein